MPVSTELQTRLDLVEERIHKAAARAGQSRSGITLIAVTKIFPPATIREAYEHGLRHFGENYVQEFAGKAADLAGLAGATYHLIGHLQSNKARQASELFQSIHTVDTSKLAARLGESGKKFEVFLEVKLSEEQSKSGAAAGAVPELVASVRAQPNLHLRGLMTVPPWSSDPEASRPYFRRLRELARHNGLAELSMGMSGDLEVAIEEGATHVRVGTALFGPRPRW